MREKRGKGERGREEDIPRATLALGRVYVARIAVATLVPVPEMFAKKSIESANVPIYSRNTPPLPARRLYRRCIALTPIPRLPADP